MPDAFRKSMTNHNTSRSLLSHLCASPKSLQGPVPVCLQAGTAAELVTLRLAPPAIEAHLHLLCFLCLHGDADTDRDRAVNVLLRIDWVRERSSGRREQKGCLLRSEFIKNSSNMDELRVSPLSGYNTVSVTKRRDRGALQVYTV